MRNGEKGDWAEVLAEDMDRAGWQLEISCYLPVILKEESLLHL